MDRLRRKWVGDIEDGSVIKKIDRLCRSNKSVMLKLGCLFRKW